MPFRTMLGSLAVLCALTAGSAAAVDEQPVDASKLPPAADKPVDFVADVQPIFEDRCYDCHGPDSAEAGLRLHHRRSALAGGDAGKAVEPGNSAASRLIHHVGGLIDDGIMPPDDYDDPLTAEEIGLLRAWIDQGAKWPDAAAGQLAEVDHWAYQRIDRPSLPDVRDTAWARNGLDRFVLRRLENEGVKPSPPADRATLIRRVTLDLIGLPPTPAEVDAFLADRSPEAYEKVVERLLASPRYGEHWAYRWLDLARYADTQGYEKDSRRTIWRYRDWVIEALNRDLPFDQFTIEQLAGDLLPEPTIEQLLATAFHRNTMTNTEGGTDDEEFRCAAVVDRVNTTAFAWMATTLNCCQCHSHKYDPFTQREYYELLAFFNNTEDHDHGDERPTVRTPTRRQQRQLALIHAELAQLADAAGAKQRVDQLTQQKQHIEKAIPTTPILRELPADKRRTTHVFLRGSFLDRGDPVEPNVPAVLHPLPQDAPRNRLGLAQWLVHRDNPLTARVQVNRAWEQTFGLGIVESSEDFGTQGTPPSHPGMLDWLAVELMDGGWSMKRLHRLIVTSATYRQSSIVTPALRERDPRNRLLARGPRVRLAAEQLRDQALAASGLLSDKMLGPSVMPFQPDAIWQIVYSGDRWTTSPGEDAHRRAVYTFWRRTSPYPSMTTFDAPSREFCVVRRTPTNTPLQALVTMNDPAFVEAAQALARRIVAEGGADTQARIAWAFRLCLTRQPTEAEVVRLAALVESEMKHYGEHPEQARAMATVPLGEAAGDADLSELAAWTVVANVLLNLDETVTKG